MLRNQVEQLSSELKNGQPESAAAQQVISDLHRLTQHAASLLPAVGQKPDQAALIDLAQGKPFHLSSAHPACPRLETVGEKAPFFFHTAQGRNEFITVDLEQQYRLFELVIANRSNGFMERARCLFYCLHNEQNPNLQKAYPLSVGDAFLNNPASLSRTNLRGMEARYVTIFSPEITCLHFARITVMGLPHACTALAESRL